VQARFCRRFQITLIEIALSARFLLLHFALFLIWKQSQIIFSHLLEAFC